MLILNADSMGELDSFDCYFELSTNKIELITEEKT